MKSQGARRTQSNEDLRGRNPLERVGPQLILEESVIFCDECRGIMHMREKRFCCLDCSELVSVNGKSLTFDVCDRCVNDHAARNPGKRHRLQEGIKKCVVAVYDTLAETVASRFECFSFNQFLGTLAPDGSAWLWTTFGDVFRMARSLATVLLRDKRADVPKLFVALSGHNCVEWVVSDMAILFCGGVSVPIDPSVTAEQALLFLAHAQATVVLAEAEVVRRIGNVTQKVLVWGSDEWRSATSLPEAEWSPIVPAESREDIRTLLFTSGSTGTPKCAVINDGALQHEFCRLQFWRPLVFFAFQPFGYSSGRLTLYDVIGNGGRETMFNGDMATYFEQLRMSRVSGFSAPPRIWNMLYAIYKSKIAGREDDPEAVKECSMDVVNLFGSHCRSVSTGGAITSRAVFKWMTDVFRHGTCNVSEGYGITEVGTVARNGVRAFECQVHLESLPEMGYLVTDKPPRGLLWVHARRGAGMASGYFHDEANTNANFRDIFKDGRMWFNTGDVVEYEAKTERLTVLDRAKNFVKLSNAVFVAPEYIENVLIESKVCNSLWVHASSEYDYVVAVVVPVNPAITKEEIFKSFAEVGAAQGLQPHEIPREIFLETGAAWTPDTGELTVSLKLNRAGLLRRYKDVLTSLRCASVPASQAAVAAAAAAEPSSVHDSKSVFESVIRDLVPNVDFSKRLLENGVNSTTLLTVTEVLKARGIVMDVAALHNETLEKLCRLASQNALPKKAARVDLGKEALLPKHVQELAASFVPRDSVCNRVFLTGATGFLGVFLLSELLQRKQEVVCLVRSATEEAGVQRLRETWKLMIGTDDAEMLRRTKVVLGDLESFVPCKLEVDSVIHCAAFVSGVFPYEALRGSNVVGTLNALSGWRLFALPFRFSL
jgi:long-subunit acyl-CoA synthetase (AMP-forming)